jgi:hypothetical protein
MHSAGARALREDDNEMSKEAVLLQWERKIEVADRLDAGERPEPEHPATPARRFVRSAVAEPPVAEYAVAEEIDEQPDEPIALHAEPVAERRTITIKGQPTPARPRRPMMHAQLAQPDRIALWAFLLGLLLVAVAAGTAHA